MSSAVPSSTAAPFQKVRATNSTQTGSYATRADTTTEPAAGDNIIQVGVVGIGPTWVELIFFGTTSADTTFKFRIYGVRRLALATSGSYTFVPIFEGVATLGTKTGVANGTVVATELYADTVTAAATSYGVVNVSYRLISPADNTVARLLLDTDGFEKVVVDFDRDGSAVSANALIAQV